MRLNPQIMALLKSARQLADDLPADAVLLLTETDLDWKTLFEILPVDKLLVVAQTRELTKKLLSYPEISVLDIDPGPTPTQETMSLALLEAVAQEKLRTGAHVIALYNGIGVVKDHP